MNGQEPWIPALEQLIDGNRRFVAGEAVHPHQNLERCREISSGQNPVAVVLACADSRVPPEVLFDQGLGDIFVVRVAGNVVGEFELASIEYAVEHLHTPLIMVLGHSSCGAISAAVAGGEAPGSLPGLMAALQPSVDEVVGKPGDHVNNAARANARRVTRALKTAQPVVAGAVDAGKVKVMAAYYDLANGKVEVL